jgi:hypothetical protein
VLLILINNRVNAQNGPLTGSGKIISKTFDYKDFDKISLRDLSGRVELEAGKPFSVKIEIDDNLESLLDVEVKNNQLEISLWGNRNNKLYIENTNIVIKISLPKITVLEHRGNAKVALSGIAGREFRMEKAGNGDVTLSGLVEELAVLKAGNGDVNARNLIAQKVNVLSSGNGDVTVNAAKNFNFKGSSNGYIKNTGSALADATSIKTGNGDIIDSGYKIKTLPYAGVKEDTRIKTSIQNNTAKRAVLKIVYPIKGSYGIDIGPGMTRKEYFPLGTKIYRQGNMGKPLFEITPENRDRILVIE